LKVDLHPLFAPAVGLTDLDECFPEPEFGIPDNFLYLPVMVFFRSELQRKWSEEAEDMSHHTRRSK